jgi:hypothetical protein
MLKIILWVAVDYVGRLPPLNARITRHVLYKEDSRVIISHSFRHAHQVVKSGRVE